MVFSLCSASPSHSDAVFSFHPSLPSHFLKAEVQSTFDNLLVMDSPSEETFFKRQVRAVCTKTDHDN
ncbi:hypothetical protein LOK49_LG07G00833 [Camellia lanceoleosa]|uniref:Uncharacterized protein n=1 Tax=Camellia lanceoleosa TaxID=1840588 RepID=A0ACC0H0V6_9ERIC|nr:hypothetical protein LOK49_LG07G00833 [Camellia lanceoleosa]